MEVSKFQINNIVGAISESSSSSIKLRSVDEYYSDEDFSEGSITSHVSDDNSNLIQKPSAKPAPQVQQ